MSLLDDAFEPFTLLNKVKVSDGYGGTVTSWTSGPTVNAAVVFDSSIEARTALANGVSSVYTVITRRNVTLEYHDALKRQSDNKVFRITSDGDDQYTPKSTSLDMRQVTAEEWELD